MDACDVSCHATWNLSFTWSELQFQVSNEKSRTAAFARFLALVLVYSFPEKQTDPLKLEIIQEKKNIKTYKKERKRTKRRRLQWRCRRKNAPLPSPDHLHRPPAALTTWPSAFLEEASYSRLSPVTSALQPSSTSFWARSLLTLPLSLNSHSLWASFRLLFFLDFN